MRTRGHGPADADDLIAGTFEVAWRQMDKLPEGREALPWLLGVARNLSRNARRKSQREAAFVNDAVGGDGALGRDADRGSSGEC